MLNRIKKRIGIIFSGIKEDLPNFPFRITFIHFLQNVICLSGRRNKLTESIKRKRDSQIFDYLYRTADITFKKYAHQCQPGIDVSERIIWICWLQGEENAPALVKKCIQSIRNHNPSCSVRLISLENYTQYISIPDYIVRKYQTGMISNAHFSDIIRMNLINDYGGLWLDATIFCARRIPDSVFEMTFFSGKSPRITGSYVSEYQWTSFILGGKAHSTFFSFMVDFYKEYWEKNNKAIDYLFMDYAIVLARNKIPFIDQCIEAVPENNLLRDEIQNHFNDKYESHQFEGWINSETYLFKTSWRMDFAKETPNGEQTYFGYFLDNLKE